MRGKSFFILLSILIFFPFGSHSQEKIFRIENFVAVMDIELGPDVPKELKIPLTQGIIDEIVNTGKFQVIDRANRDKILVEQGFQLTECVSEECRVKAGRLLGVGKLIVGSVYKVGKVFFSNLLLINVETGQIENSIKHKCPCEMEELLEVIPSIARKMIAGEEKIYETQVKEEKEKYALIDISSSPSGADVWIDDKNVGKTPLSSIKVSPGEHTVKMSLKGYDDILKKFTVASGETKKFSGTFKKKTEKEEKIILEKKAPRWKKVLSWVGVGVGAVSMGLGIIGMGVAFKDQDKADKAYQNYINAIDQEEMDRWWHEVEQSDRAARNTMITSLILIGIGAISTGSGIYGVLSTRAPHEKLSEKKIDAGVEISQDRVMFKVRVKP